MPHWIAKLLEERSRPEPFTACRECGLLTRIIILGRCIFCIAAMRERMAQKRARGAA